MNDVDTIIQKYLPQSIREFKPYRPGKSSNDFTKKKKYIKLSSNECGYPTAPLLLQSLRRYIKQDRLSRYPDDSVIELRKALMKKHDISKEQLLITNGSNDAIVAIARLLLASGGEAICSDHCFAVFPWIVNQLGNTLHHVPTHRTPQHPFAQDLDALYGKVNRETRLLYLANPDNPTGSYIPSKVLVSFISSLPKSTFVIVDQAYFDFIKSEPALDFCSLIHEYPNCIVLRTFSKAYGLAQLRVGYLAAHESLVAFLRSTKLAFSVNGLAMHCANEVLHAPQNIKKQVSQTIVLRKNLETIFDAHSIRYAPSQGNFISYHQTQQLNYHSLLDHGIITRELNEYGIAPYSRISIGTPSEMKVLFSTIKKLLSHG
ncbi:MAG: histidinol-phosphate transaminase [Methylacidiphilales bacterium]|nr:histidinol-phosphate transaminase [Candidatus Methylacidiphilales bacterium]